MTPSIIIYVIISGAYTARRIAQAMDTGMNLGAFIIAALVGMQIGWFMLPVYVIEKVLGDK